MASHSHTPSSSGTASATRRRRRSHGYAAGALLYESPALSSMPVDGRDYGVVQYNGEALSLEWDSQRPRFSLQETRELTREDLYTLLPSLADQEARSGNLLAPQDTQSITVRIYGPSDSASDAPAGSAARS